MVAMKHFSNELVEVTSFFELLFVNQLQSWTCKLGVFSLWCCRFHKFCTFCQGPTLCNHHMQTGVFLCPWQWCSWLKVSWPLCCWSWRCTLTQLTVQLQVVCNITACKLHCSVGDWNFWVEIEMEQLWWTLLLLWFHESLKVFDRVFSHLHLDWAMHPVTAEEHRLVGE